MYVSRDGPARKLKFFAVDSSAGFFERLRQQKGEADCSQGLGQSTSDKGWSVIVRSVRRGLSRFYILIELPVVLFRHIGILHAKFFELCGEGLPKPIS